jgi:LPS sulfotransferase NodH
LGQALSWHRALESDRWAHWQEEVRVPRYRRAGVRARLEAIGKAETAWDRELAGDPVWEVTYEQLIHQPEKTVRDVLAWLDVPDAHQVCVPGFPVQRQADEESKKWRIRWASGA